MRKFDLTGSPAIACVIDATVSGNAKIRNQITILEQTITWASHATARFFSQVQHLNRFRATHLNFGFQNHSLPTIKVFEMRTSRHSDTHFELVY